MAWITIPRYAQPGQQHAFADRVDELGQIYSMLVHAGNAVRAGGEGIALKICVSGYRGVGKSSLILQALGMIRDELGIVTGQRLALPPGLPEPKDRERWLILRVSGKSVAGIDAIADSIRNAVLDVLADAAGSAPRQLPHALELGIIHRLLPTRAAQDYERVRDALRELALTIEYVRSWQGGIRTDKLNRSERVETTGDVGIQLAADLKAKGLDARTDEAKAAVHAAAGFARKWSTVVTQESSMEHKLAVGADLVVQALNAFFQATDEAHIPTILVLDDFDEFAASAGPSVTERAHVISNVIGVFNRLAPTCLILAIRSEYMHEDIHRQYQVQHVPPFTRGNAKKVLEAWLDVQAVEPSDIERVQLGELGDRLLAPFALHETVVVPDLFLQFISWAANNGLKPGESDLERLRRYAQSKFGGQTYRAILRVADVMPTPHIRLCLEAVPLDPRIYSLTDQERNALEQHGLLKPAMAGTQDTNVYMDPLFGYLAATERGLEP